MGTVGSNGCNLEKLLVFVFLKKKTREARRALPYEFLLKN